MIARDDPYENLRGQLKSIRVMRGLKHGDVANLIGISRPQYTAIEGGRSMVSFQHLHNLAIILGVKIIIGDTGGSRIIRKYRERKQTPRAG